MTPILMNPALLDASMAGKLGARMEKKYQDAYGVLVRPTLRAKYRSQRLTYQQWGVGGDHTGKASIQGKAKPQVQRNRVMVVDGLTGHKVMQDA